MKESLEATNVWFEGRMLTVLWMKQVRNKKALKKMVIKRTREASFKKLK